MRETYSRSFPLEFSLYRLFRKQGLIIRREAGVLPERPLGQACLLDDLVVIAGDPADLGRRTFVLFRNVFRHL